jgi:hypothetical protein
MKRSVLVSFLLVLGFCGIRAVEDVDFTDIDLILQAPLKRSERSPDYGTGLGGPLAANGAPPAPGSKPAPSAPSPPPPPPPPTTKATTKAQATTKKAGSNEKATTKGPTAPTKAPAKQEKSDNGGGGGNGKSGEDIANQLYNHPNECKDPKDGGVWAPLPNGQTCGSDGNCPYPKKWCSAKQDSSSSNSPKLSCQDLPPECQQALAGGGATTAAAAPAADTTASQQATTTAATTKASTAASSQKPTTKASAAGGTTAPPSASCDDKHPYCCFWADDKQGRPSECDRNSKWMKTNCGKSCGTCGCTTGDCPSKVNTAGCQWTQGGANGQGHKTRIVLGGGPSPFGNLGGASPGGAGTGAAGPSPVGGGTPGGSSTMTKIFVGKK